VSRAVSPFGIDSSFQCSGGVSVSPGANIQNVLNSNADGATFCFEPGVYRIGGRLSPKNNQKLIGGPGVIISGAKALDQGWTQDGSQWWIGGQTQEIEHIDGATSGEHHECTEGHPQCTYCEMVFFDDRALWVVKNRNEVTDTSFYFDYGADRIYIGRDPSGHKVEATVAAQAFGPGGGGVLLKNLVIEKFGTPDQNGTVTAGGRWVVENCEIRNNHGIGIKNNGNSTTRYCYIHHNGQMGMGSSDGGGAMTVEYNEVAYNNIYHYNPWWEAGACKYAWTNGVTLRGNYSHHNNGIGIWHDINNRNAVYEDNFIEYNYLEGILHEISYNAIIRNNIIRFNGRYQPNWWGDGAGITIFSSSDCEVYGNVLERNGGGVAIRHDSRGWSGNNNYIHDNVIVIDANHEGDPDYPNDAGHGFVATTTTSGNRFEKNTYYVRDGLDPEPFEIVLEANGQKFTERCDFYGWQNEGGHDLEGVAYSIEDWDPSAYYELPDYYPVEARETVKRIFERKKPPRVKIGRSSIPVNASGNVRVAVYSLTGRKTGEYLLSNTRSGPRLPVPSSPSSSGAYVCTVRSQTDKSANPVVILK
jgi:hypothetical protein